MSQWRRISVADVPVDLFLAMVEHHEEMLRELSLIDIGVADEPVVSQEVIRVRELLPPLRARFGMTRGTVLERVHRARLQQRSTVDVDVEMPVSTELADSVEATLEALEKADERCRDGELLTLAATPEVAALRRRVATEIAKQLRS